MGPSPENVDDAEFIDADEEELSESSPDRGHGEWPEPVSGGRRADESG